MFIQNFQIFNFSIQHFIILTYYFIKDFVECFIFVPESLTQIHMNYISEFLKINLKVFQLNL